MPPSLKVLNLSGDRHGTHHKFTGGIPAEWGLLTNLKELKMVACNLDGVLMYAQSRAKNLTSPRTGAIPASIGNLTTLVSLKLAENALEGESVYHQFDTEFASD